MDVSWHLPNPRKARVAVYDAVQWKDTKCSRDASDFRISRIVSEKLADCRLALAIPLPVAKVIHEVSLCRGWTDTGYRAYEAAVSTDAASGVSDGVP